MGLSVCCRAGRQLPWGQAAGTHRPAGPGHGCPFLRVLSTVPKVLQAKIFLLDFRHSISFP